MNKQAKTPKTSRGVYIKFILIMIASALTGALISIFLLGREDGLMQLAQQAGDCLTQAGPWLMALGAAGRLEVVRDGATYRDMTIRQIHA